jgi:hypothetical protein
MIFATNIADSIILKILDLSSGNEKSAAYVKEAIIKVFRDPIYVWKYLLISIKEYTCMHANIVTHK